MNNKRQNRAILRQRLFTLTYSLALIGVIVLLSAALIKLQGYTAPSSVSEGAASSAPKETSFKETSLKVISTGDIMVHSPQLTGAYDSATNSYDFSHYFTYTAPYFQAADLSVGNLEVTFGGEDREFSGYPVFNTPDTLADAIKASGLNFLVTSNNHSYDTGLSGLRRTAQVLKQKGIEFTGTKETVDDPSYTVKELNNIKIGIVNYTYETSPADPIDGRKYLNGSLISEEANGLINSFSYNNTDAFYTDIESKLNAMRNEGAEFFLVYIHWGNEYQTSPNTHQKAIAQRLCNMGFDMIIGSHPHVIQPVELITSEDSAHTAICVYSTGNAVSNQRQELMTSCPTGHTEDGMLFEFTLSKTQKGVALSSLNLIPTWVNKYSVNGKNRYTIYPMEDPNNLGSYGFDAASLTKARRSYERTKEIVGKGLTECQQAIGCEITFK